MAYQDKTIQCSDCGTNFTFSADEQEQFAQRGYTNEPKRCPTCRQSRKARQGGESTGGYRGNSNSSSSYGSRPSREMFPVKCSECGKDTEVPFKPSGDRPVYCSDCFRKIRPPTR
jgi:CxxC-x17-CxxC domain-containing protein